MTAHNIGIANIIVATTDGSNLTACCKITVAELVKSISVTPNMMTIKEGDTLQLSCSVMPETATYKDIIRTSDNNDIASVDSNGLVTAILSGTTKIKANASDGSNVFGECEIKVTPETLVNNGICYQRNSPSTLKIIANTANPYSGDFFIPEKADFKGQEMSVTEIGTDAFTQCKNLTRIVIPNTINKINDSAFKGCSNLEYVKICDGSSLVANFDILFSESPITELYVGSDGIIYDSNSRILSMVKGMTLGNSVTTFPPLKAFDSLRYFIVEDGEMPIDEPEDYCSASKSLINKQTIRNEYSQIYYALFILIKYRHLFPITNAIDNSILNYLHIGREVNKIQVDTSLIKDYIPTTAGDRYVDFGYKDEVNYQYQELIVINDFNQKPVESLSFDKSIIELNPGESIKPALAFTPTNASFTTLEWSSSDEDVAIVDIFGNVTKLQDGEAAITATTTDGTNLSATCKIVDKGSAVTDTVTPSEHDDYTVYNLQGIFILKTDDTNCIKQLPTGIYIINGKKVMIK